MSTAATRRLHRELQLVQREPSWGVSAAPLSEDLYTWHCNVAGQPPAGGAPVILHLELTFSAEYPVRPPRVEVLGSTVTHPNVFSTFICLDMLEGGEWAADEEKRRPYMGWSSAYSILAILRQLQTFFFEGDGTQWWKCQLCTLHNPMKNKRCEACDTTRGACDAIGINVEHTPHFQCRCGHQPCGPHWPPFPQSVECDDAPVANVLPEACLENSCVICLGHLDDDARGALKGAPAARPLAQLVDREGQLTCKHFFHLPCAQQLKSNFCPLCRSPFAKVAALPDQQTARGAAKSELSPQPLCQKALEQMARFAGWPLGMVIQLMSFLRRHERVCLSFAVPAWQEAAAAPLFWEAQEVQCFHEKMGPNEDVIGIGVLAQGRGRLATLTAHFDAISRTAWQGGLRKAAWKEPLSHWLPLFIHEQHSRAAAELLSECLHLLADSCSQEQDSHIPPLVFQTLEGRAPAAVDAIVAFPEMMHQLMKQVLYGDRHASLKLLKGYFVMHRLFLHCCDQWPEIRAAADLALQQFLRSEEGRTKQSTPWLAYILQLLTISNVGWDDVKKPFLEEALAREVQFILPRYPKYCPTLPEEETQAAPELPSEWTTDQIPGSDQRTTSVATELSRHTIRGAERGWTCISGVARGTGSSAFSVQIRSMPVDSAIRIGWVSGDGDLLVGQSSEAWGYHASRSYGHFGWKAHGGRWTRYGPPFEEGDTITAVVQEGEISFMRNGQPLGVAFKVPSHQLPKDASGFRPAVAIRRAAEVHLIAEAPEMQLSFSPEEQRDVAWDANRRGNTLIMFQVFFLSLVRPKGGMQDWSQLKEEYDKRYGFPAPEMSAALFEMFSEVHQIRQLPGHFAWRKFLDLIGFPDLGMEELQVLLRQGYERAKTMGYKQGGRRDHA